MLLKVLKGKIHRARVTKTKVDYPGSVAIDADLLDAAGIRPYESVLLANVTNACRAETYVIEAPRGSRDVEVLGAAAKMFSPKDIIIVLNFAFMTPEELTGHKPSVIALDEDNQIIQKK